MARGGDEPVRGEGRFAGEGFGPPRPAGATRPARPSRPARPARPAPPARSPRPVAQRRPGTAPAAEAVRRPGPPPPPQPVRRFPNPRLTGLGSGLFGAAVMLVLGYVDALLFGSSLTAYSVLFLPVCVLTAVWVRKGDLMTAPVVLPIAFTVGLIPVADTGGGLGDHLMGLFTALATQAGWLYGGTLIAGLIVTVRKAALLARRAAARRRPQ
ncbi:DUF6542 domain-containing protein [Streptomyces sp. NPDC059010]|uniref:DUF6542 domain-containing protein n=1 Tax=Streptomyces sp. NPDC059010 TaxID=3346695 RepID=UPI0036B2683C